MNCFRSREHWLHVCSLLIVLALRQASSSVHMLQGESVTEDSSLRRSEAEYPSTNIAAPSSCFRHSTQPISSVLTSKFSRQLTLLIRKRLGPMTKQRPFILAAGQGTAASRTIAAAIRATGTNTIHCLECRPACKTITPTMRGFSERIRHFVQLMRNPLRNTSAASVLEMLPSLLAAIDVALQAIVNDRIFALADSPWTNLFSEFYVALCPDVRVVLSLRDELEWAQSRKRGHAHSQYGFVCTAAAAQKRRGELIDEQLHSLAESTLTRQGRAHMERSPPPAPNPTHFQTEPKSNVNAKGRNVSWSLGAPPVADAFSYSQCQPQERDGQLVRSAYDFADVDAETLRDAFEQYNEYVRTLVPAAHLLEVNFFRSDQSGAPLVNISAFSRIQEQLVTQFVTPFPPKIWKK